MTTWKLSRYFASKGHDVAVFSATEIGHECQEFARLFHAKGGSDCRLDALRRALSDFKPQIVINQMPYDHELGGVLLDSKDYLLLGCLRNTLYSVRMNIGQFGDRVLPGIVKPIFRNVAGRSILLAVHRVRHRLDLKRILRTYDRFVMFGPPNLDELRFFLPHFDYSKICLIPNSVPSVLHEIPRKEKRLLWLGRLTYVQKRADLILPLWRKVSESLPDWHLDVVGDGPALNDLRRTSKLEGIERITFHGRQKPENFFESASIFAMTSAFEGFPNTLVEAQSFGAIPVLFDSFPIAGWMINDGVDGFLIPPFDVESMADRVVTIAQSQRRTQLMNCALDNARRFQVEKVGQMWMSLFEDCANLIPGKTHDVRTES